MGYGDLSCLNEKSKIKTTHLDRLAAEGLVYTDAHASSAVCTPSRYSILTGRYCWRSRLKKFVLMGYDTHLIEKDRLTVANMLQTEGYQTACIGKWHLGLDWAKREHSPDGVDYTQPIQNGPTAFGFDYFYGISASLDMPPYAYIENDRVTAIPDHMTENEGKKMWRKGLTAPDFKHEEVLPNITEKVLGKIDEYAGNPFFIYFPLPAPHTPILPTREFQGKTGTNEYGDFVLMCDDVVGQIMKELDEKGIANQTILIFTSDNGCSPKADFEELSEVGHHPSYIFRGYKADIYEGGHRIPLIVRWPEHINAGSITDEPVCLVDFMATCAELLGVSLPEDAAEDSVSELPLWKGIKLKKPLREAIVHHSIDGSFSIRKKNWKLEMCPGSGGWSEPIPGHEPHDAPPFQLFDLSEDIGETNNVYNDQPIIVKELKQLLIQYIINGRSTPGSPQKNTDGNSGPQLHWLND
jgi:arylsulfatase A-like enzyme